MSNKKKKKKEKITYIDDGRTIADMSNVTGSRKRLETDDDRFVRQRPTIKEVLKTYFKAVKSMLVPMFITLGALTVVFFFAYLILGGFRN